MPRCLLPRQGFYREWRPNSWSPPKIDFALREFVILVTDIIYVFLQKKTITFYYSKVLNYSYGRRNLSKTLALVIL